MEFNFTPSSDGKDPLKEFGRNLTDLAIKGKLDPVIGRDDEIRRLIRIISRKTKNNPILVGEPGVGKTAIIEGLARKIVSGDVPENLKNKELIEIDLTALIAGASYQGQFEKRLKDLMKAIEDAAGNVIVFIDEIHMLIGTGKSGGGQGGMDAANIIKPMLARGEMRLIGATTLDEHRKYIESDPALERRLQKVMVDEPTQEETIAILRGIKERFESYHGVRIHDNAIVSAVKLSARYISDRFLPDKAIDLIDEAAAGVQTEMNSKPEELEKNEQKLAMLEMEKAALSKEKDAKSAARLIELKEKIEVLHTSVNQLKNKWTSEKKIIKDIADTREKLDQAKTLQHRTMLDGDFEKSSILLYKEIPSLEKKLKELEENASKRESFMVKEDITENEIADVVSKWTHIPVNKLLQNQKEKVLNLQSNMMKRIKGQDEAIEKVSDAIIRSRANINDPNRPIGSFIFMGPTGVGKTEVAKSLAEELFDTEKDIVRIDLSEYGEKHSVARLIGAPPGYMGFEQGGQLTEAVRRTPYSIILLDEIEKAHPEVLNVLLQVLDEGHLTDGRGKTVNFKNTIVIMTTNLGSIELLEGKKIDEVKILNKHLKPEFINRVDEIVIFKPLTERSLALITQQELDKLVKRVAEQNINISFDPKVAEKVVEESYDPIFGARPIKRFVKNNIETKIARMIIKGEIKEESPYIINYVDGDLTVKVKKLS